MQFEITLTQVVTAIIIVLVIILLHRCKCSYYDVEINSSCETCGGKCEGYETPKHKMKELYDNMDMKELYEPVREHISYVDDAKQNM